MLERIIEEFHNDFLKTNDINKSLENIISDLIKTLPEPSVDLNLLKRILFQQIEPLKTLKKIENSEEIEEIFENTLDLFDYNFNNNQKELLKKICKNDFSIILDDTRVFQQLFNLIFIIFSHIEKLNELETLEEESINKKGIAKTSYEDLNKAIEPKINLFNEISQLNDSKESRLQKNLYEDFNSNPLETNFMLNTLDSMDLKEVFKDRDKDSIQTLLNHNNSFLNSATKLEDTDIFKSCQISCMSILSHPYLDISKTNIINYVNELLESFFNYEFESKLTTEHLKKVPQIKSHFKGLNILEYRTPRFYKQHPLLD